MSSIGPTCARTSRASSDIQHPSRSSARTYQVFNNHKAVWTSSVLFVFPIGLPFISSARSGQVARFSAIQRRFNAQLRTEDWYGVFSFQVLSGRRTGGPHGWLDDEMTHMAGGLAPSARNHALGKEFCFLMRGTEGGPWDNIGCCSLFSKSVPKILIFVH